jgi:hypothetical protein
MAEKSLRASVDWPASERPRKLRLRPRNFPDCRFSPRFLSALRVSVVNTRSALLQYTEIGKRLYELLDREYQAGRIAEAVFRRIRGN